MCCGTGTGLICIDKYRFGNSKTLEILATGTVFSRFQTIEIETRNPCVLILRVVLDLAKTIDLFVFIFETVFIKDLLPPLKGKGSRHFLYCVAVRNLSIPSSDSVLLYGYSIPPSVDSTQFPSVIIHIDSCGRPVDLGQSNSFVFESVRRKEGLLKMNK